MNVTHDRHLSFNFQQIWLFAELTGGASEDFDRQFFRQLPLLDEVLSDQICVWKSVIIPVDTVEG